MKARSDRPNVFPWPPLLLAGLASFGFLSHRLIPDRTFFPGHLLAGGLISLGGLVLIVAALVTFARHRSNILPHRPASELITTGAFRLSRNPIYAGEVAVLGGLGIALGSPGLTIAAAILALAVDIVGIRREEQHLLARFGEDWVAYRRRVRRWL